MVPFDCTHGYHGTLMVHVMCMYMYTDYNNIQEQHVHATVYDIMYMYVHRHDRYMYIIVLPVRISVTPALGKALVGTPERCKKP